MILFIVEMIISRRNYHLCKIILDILKLIINFFNYFKLRRKINMNIYKIFHLYKIIKFQQ